MYKSFNKMSLNYFMKNIDNSLIGHHIFTSNGFKTCAEYAETTGANVFQIFINSPKSFKTIRKKNDLIYLGKDAEKRNIKIVVHGNFMANLCNPPGSFIFNKGCEILISELNDSVILKSIGVVIHMGKNVKKLEISKETATYNYIRGINRCLEYSEPNSILILETGAGQGTEISTDIIDLGILRKRIDKKHRHRVKFCIDTCHIFAAGYNISDQDYVKFLEKHIDIHLGWDNVKVIHFNDSKTKLNSRVDRHADIGKGMIQFEGLIDFFKICVDKDIPIVLETPADTYNGKKYSYSDQIKIVKNYIKNGILETAL